MTSTTVPMAELQALGSVSVPHADGVVCQRSLGEIRRVRGFLDALEARLIVRIDSLEANGDSFGAEDVMARCSNVSSAEAARRARRSRALDDTPGFAEALATGDITADHVDQLANISAKLPADLRTVLLERPGGLLSHARAHDPARFGRHVRDVARNLARDAGISRDRQQKADTFMSWKVLPDGMYELHAQLHPLLGNRLIRMVDAEVAARVATGEAAGDPEFVTRTVDRGRLAAEALVDLATSGHQMVRPVMAEISVLIDAESLATGRSHDHAVAETSHGAPVPISSVPALLCGGLITPIGLGNNGVALNLGRTTRTPSRAQRRALRAMYRTCAAHGCEVLFDRCEVHHIIEWDPVGLTDLDNIVPLCSRHHHQVHSHGWRLHLDADRTLTVTDRHGAVVMVTTPDMPHPFRHRGRRTEPAAAGGPPIPATTESAA